MDLPFIDEHRVDLRVPPAVAFDALVPVVRRAFTGAGASLAARALGCVHARAWGVFPAVGTTLPGFRVAHVLPPYELDLEGKHRFASYALRLRVDPTPHGSVVRALTNADFPGVTGRAYRLAVIGTRGHVVVVRRMLAAVRRRAERARG